MSSFGSPLIGGESAFYDAFWRIMDCVIMPDTVKESLYKAAFEDFTHGVARPGKTYHEILAGVEWQWSLFDKWEQIFLSNAEYPPMWYLYFKNSTFNSENHIDFIPHLKFQDLKKIAMYLGVILPKGRLKKNDVLACVEPYITMDILHKALPLFIETTIEKAAQIAFEEKCSIFCRYIAGTAYGLIRYRNSLPLCIGEKPMFKFKLLFFDSPIERKYTPSLLLDREENLPPYFPGDRTDLTAMTKRAAERAGVRW